MTKILFFYALGSSIMAKFSDGEQKHIHYPPINSAGEAILIADSLNKVMCVGARQGNPATNDMDMRTCISKILERP